MSREPARGAGSSWVSVDHHQEDIPPQTASAVWQSLGKRVSIVEKQPGFVWAQQHLPILSQSCSPAREPDQMGWQSYSWPD